MAGVYDDFGDGYFRVRGFCAEASIKERTKMTELDYSGPRVFTPSAGWIESVYAANSGEDEVTFVLEAHVRHPELERAQALVDAWIQTRGHRRDDVNVESYDFCTCRVTVIKRTGTQVVFRLSGGRSQDILDCLFECCLAAFYKQEIDSVQDVSVEWVELPAVLANR